MTVDPIQCMMAVAGSIQVPGDCGPECGECGSLGQQDATGVSLTLKP